ncbi:ParB/RepB/Spo0J family partition protein [Streptomyces sp. NPDC053513]|uniref:ParB/RepB/Spo0J family partition protein n=1 Tax=unclassified Streptomyces TaxID=2593676 RepID=UPI0037CF5F00
MDQYEDLHDKVMAYGATIRGTLNCDLHDHSSGVCVVWCGTRLQGTPLRHGSQEKVAERIGKSQMYVSNRLALLNLPPELQDAVDTKQLKVKTAEEIVKIQDPEQQKAVAAEELRKAQAPKVPRKCAAALVASPVQNPVLHPAQETASNSGGVVAVASLDVSEPTVIVPEPRITEAAQVPAAAEVPWHDGSALMDAALVRAGPGPTQRVHPALLQTQPGRRGRHR